MEMILSTVYLLLLLSNFNSWTQANSEPSPRMIITGRETTMNRIYLPPHHEPIWLYPGGDAERVITAGHKDLILFNPQNPQESVTIKVPWQKCFQQQDCKYNITMVHKTKEANRVFVCGTDGSKTECCYMNLSEESPLCIPEVMDVPSGYKTFMDTNPSVLVESEDSANLFVAHSGLNEIVGVHKFGRDSIEPDNKYEENHYVGLLYNRRNEDPLQDRVYAFYNEKSKSADLYSERWTPYVSQVCTSDKGGSKQLLQFTWTSQLNARLFCGDAANKLYFSELVDVATVHAKLWSETKIYALFRNEWGMSAVCVYTLGNIDRLFMESKFKGVQSGRSRVCVSESTSIPLMTLDEIQKTSEMEQWILPLWKSPLLISRHHSYTHILVDSSFTKSSSQHHLLFLSLNNGGIHKVINNNSQTFVIAEYHPFNSRTHIRGLALNPSSRKLYVTSRDELVQLDVANCAHYGCTCEECVLSRDPYCKWDGSTCSPQTGDTTQDVMQGDFTICRSESDNQVNCTGVNAKKVTLAPNSQHFLHCPMTSHHAQYTWHHSEDSTPCSLKDQQCLLLINSMGPKQEGKYECVAVESGYRRTVALYQLEVRSRAVGYSLSPLLWVLLTTLLIRTLSS